MSEAANEQIIATKIEYSDEPPVFEQEEEIGEVASVEEVDETGDGEESADGSEESLTTNEEEEKPASEEESEAKEENKPEENSEAKPDEAEEQETEEQIFTQFSERAGVEVKSEDDLIQKLQKLAKYEKGEIEFTPKFKSDAQKKAYEVITNAQEGHEFKEAARVINFLAQDFNSMEPKEVLKQAFIEDHKEDYTAEEASKLFERRFSKQYSLDAENDDPDDVEVSKLELKKDAKDALKKLTDIQNQLKAPKVEQVQDQSAEKAEAEEKQRNYVAQVDEAFKDQSGEDLEIAVSDKSDENFTFKFDNMAQVKEYALDANKFFSRYVDNKGVVAWDKYKTEMGVLANLEAYTKALINHGRTLGRIDSDAKLKNPSATTKAVPMPKAQVKTEGQQLAEQWAAL